jgi:hypothetical protein
VFGFTAGFAGTTFGFFITVVSSFGFEFTEEARTSFGEVTTVFSTKTGGTESFLFAGRFL